MTAFEFIPFELMTRANLEDHRMLLVRELEVQRIILNKGRYIGNSFYYPGRNVINIAVLALLQKT